MTSMKAHIIYYDHEQSNESKINSYIYILRWVCPLVPTSEINIALLPDNIKCKLNKIKGQTALT